MLLNRFGSWVAEESFQWWNNTGIASTGIANASIASCRLLLSWNGSRGSYCRTPTIASLSPNTMHRARVSATHTCADTWSLNDYSANPLHRARPPAVLSGAGLAFRETAGCPSNGQCDFTSGTPEQEVVLCNAMAIFWQSSGNLLVVFLPFSVYKDR